ncbi:hypothetical protein [Novosphingobium capsulatum]|uniref:hypothetical protein n=1 Tax=Novosphingobium capsulatum TaxID=13688 RepID=UPI000AE96C9B|nr:hypothetical protein [Novosphingobium capsulatum]WQD93682.1 hypothetical protein U0041_03565 [Novosphingobium capsulatum]
MAAATQSSFAANGAWQDIAATLTAAANTDVLLQNTGQQPVKVCFGGATAPASDLAGVTINPRGTIVGNAANVWVRSPGGTNLAVTVGHSGGVSGNVASLGNVAAGAADAGNPVKVGGVYSATLPTLADGQRGNMQLTNKGALAVTLFSSAGSAFTAIAPANGTTNPSYALAVAGFGMQHNGATWDLAKKPASTNRLLSAAATTNATSVKTSGADLFRVRGHNASASARYLKLYNKASAPTVGTDTPVATYYLAPSAPFDIDFQTALYFSAGLAFALTGAAPDSDTTALAAGDILCLNIHYA